MISVIIPSYNSENTIIKCLESLYQQSYKDAFEIILIDSSIDSTPQIVSKNYPGIQLIHLEQKTDPGTARNCGIKKSAGDIIAFIDSDCVAPHDWLDKIAAAHKVSPYNVIGGSVCNNNNNNLIALAGYLAEFREYIPELPKRETTHIPTCNVSYKKFIFQRYGLFQGHYYPQEDLAFNYKLTCNKEMLLFDPDIRVYHHHRTNLKHYLLHQKKIGQATSRLLKTIDLEGAFIARHPVLALFLIPFLPFIKFSRTILLFLRYEPKIVLSQPLVLLVFALGLLFWLAGFSIGIYSKKILA